MADSPVESEPKEKTRRSKRRVAPDAAEAQPTSDRRDTGTPVSKPATPANISVEEIPPPDKIAPEGPSKDNPELGDKTDDKEESEEHDHRVVHGHLPVSFSTQQTVTQGGLTFALFTKSLQTLIALREVKSAQKNELFYSLIVLLYVAMLLNVLHAIVLVWLGIVKKDRSHEQLERAQTLIHMSSFVTLIMVLIEVCIATLHVHVSANSPG